MHTGGLTLKKKKEKVNNRVSLFSNLHIRTKALLICSVALTAALTMAAAMVLNAYFIRQDKFKENEKLMITSTEQLMEMAIENGVSIAGKLYNNEELFEFLDYNYKDTQEYYDAFYKFHQSNPLAIAETNLIRRYTLFTDNPTIMSGTDVIQLDTVKDAGWYNAYNKLNKTLILYCDPQTGAMSLIRKISTTNCKSYLKLDINVNLMKNYIDSMDFEGQLYIVSGGTVIYSNRDKNDLDSIAITQDFECFTKNYYSADIEYYSRADGGTLMSLLVVIWPILALFLAMTAVLFFVSRTISKDMVDRINAAKKIYAEKGDLVEMKDIQKGTDEISEMIDLCISMSDSMKVGSSEFIRSSDALREKTEDYSKLFTTAMRLDAELLVDELYPDIAIDDDAEMISLVREGAIINKLVKKYRTAHAEIANDLKKDIMVPAYSLVLLADQLFHSEGNPKITLRSPGNRIELVYENDVRPSAARILKLQAIFEDANISDEYSFNRRSIYNPYYRIKHCFGDDAVAEISNKSGFQMTISIQINMETGDE